MKNSELDTFEKVCKWVEKNVPKKNLGDSKTVKGCGVVLLL